MQLNEYLKICPIKKDNNELNFYKEVEREVNNINR
jgi:hypothetical protein